MAQPEEKVVKIIDESVHTRGASVEQVDSQGALVVKSVNSFMDAKQNGSTTLVYTGGVLTSLVKTVGSSSYTKTLTYTDGVLTNISAWSIV